MLARRAPSVLGWTRRDAAVQLGAVSGAIRAVLRAIDEVLAESSDEVSERRSWRLMALDSEIASPLYSVEEQAPIRARLRSLAEAPNPPGVTTAAGGVVARIVEAMTPPER